MKDKLIELIKSRRDPCDIGACPFTVDDVRPCSLCEAESLAEHLIANGVTIADDNNVGSKRNIRPIDAYTLAEEIESLQVTVGGKPAHWYDAKHTVLRMIAEQPDVPETNVGKWIPVSDRLPDPRCSIEMYFPSKEMVCLGFFEKVGQLNIWCVYTPNSANVCHINPTHWRYRTIVPASPEPPKEGE